MKTICTIQPNTISFEVAPVTFSHDKEAIEEVYDGDASESN